MNRAQNIRVWICFTVFWAVCLTVMGAGPAAEQAPVFAVTGRVVSAEGEPMPGATVAAYRSASDAAREAAPVKAVSVNNYGTYAFTLAGGSYHIVASFVGYNRTGRDLNVDGPVTLDITMTPSATTVDDIIISARGNRVRGTQMGMESLSPGFVKSMPALMGEADLMKSLQMLPGVQATSEGGSGFSVRGGSHDQNLILLDDATLYNASHLMGFFSVFNNDVVDNVTLYKGDIPASFGGRLSSLLDVRTRDGGRERLSGSGGVGLIASRLSLEGPMWNDRTGFLVSGRRTYADLFLKVLPDEDLRKSKLYFYDMNLRLAWEPGEKDRIYLSGYLGRDKMGTSFLGMDFGNKALSLRWGHVFTPKIYGSVSFTGSGYDYKVTAKFGKEIDQYWKSGMTDFGTRGEMLFLIGEGHSLRAGWNMVYHRFRPGDMASRTDDPMLGEIKLPRQDAVENGVYLSAESPLPWDMLFKYGLRVSFFANIASDKSLGAGNYNGVYRNSRYGRRHNFEPRLGIVKHIGDRSSVKASYSRTAQYIHIASNSTAGSPLDVWFQSSPAIKPQLSDQYSVGWFSTMQGGIMELSVETYYRKLHNTIDFRDHANLILNENLEDEILVGKGYAYGAEGMLKYTRGQFDGWVSYTYARSKRKTSGINDDRWYRSQFDRPHNLNLVGTYNIGEKWSVSAGWVYSTGSPISFPTGRFLIESEYVPIYDGRNKHRYPDYHRLDVSATMQMARKRERYRSELSFSLYNAYGRKNPWMISFKEEDNAPGSFYAEQIYLFSVVPSITWNFYF